MSSRAVLLNAAEGVFRRLGYRRARVEDVARAAGIGKGSVYLLFESKEALYLAVVDAAMGRLLGEFEVVVRSGETAPDRLRAVVEAAIEGLGSDELLRSSLMGAAEDRAEQLTFRRAAVAQRSRVSELLAECLRQGLAEGSIRGSLDVERAGVLMFEMGWSVVRAQLEGVLTVPLPDALETMAEIMGLGIAVRGGR